MKTKGIVHGGFKMRHDFGAEFSDVRLRPLEEKDIEKLRVWRNDTSKTQYLRRIPKITPEMQKKWFEEYLNNPDEIIFAIEEIKELRRVVGSVALYNFHGEIAEIGKIQIGDTEANGRGIGRKSMVMAIWIGIKKMGLKKIIGAVHQDNIAAYKNDVKIGFKIVGKHMAPMGGYEDEIEINEKQLKEANDYIDQIIFL